MQKIFFAFLLLFACDSFAAAQPPQKNASQIKEFGWSLKQKPPENAAENKDQVAEAGADDEEVISVETNLVVSDVFVGDRTGSAVTNLKKEDFIVVEDGEPQTVETFAPGDDANVPRSIVLVMDHSISQLPYLETSVEAAKALVDQLNPRDKMAIVTDDVELFAAFTQDKNSLKSKLDQLKTKALSGKLGQSWQYSALYAVFNEIFDRTDIRPIIFFQTDGDEDYALKNSKILSAGRLPEREFSFADVLTAAEKSGATVYTIIPGADYTNLSESAQLEKARADYENRRHALARIGEAPPKLADIPEGLLMSGVKATLRRQAYLDELSKSTGGWTSALEAPEQASAAYQKILSAINQRYVIGYYPANETRDGKRRTVKITIRNHPEYTVQGRKTYLPAAPR